LDRYRYRMSILLSVELLAKILKMVQLSKKYVILMAENDSLLIQRNTE